MTEGRFEAYYAPGLGAKYALRSWIVSAVVAGVGVPVIWFTFVGNPQWWVLVLLILVFGFVLLITVSAAVTARSKWGADGGLAIAIDDAGITLPRVGSLAWDEIAEIGITDTGFVHGNVWFRAWEALTGSSTNRFVRVRAKDSADLLARYARIPSGAAPSETAAASEHFAFQGVWGEGLRSPTWDETADAVAAAAKAHGVTLHDRK